MNDADSAQPRITDPLQALRLILPAAVFTDAELAELAQRCSLLRLEGEQVLIREGEPSDNKVYFLLGGSVSVSIQERFILRLQKRGDSIGEMGLISAAPRSATVTTDGPAQFLVLDAHLREQLSAEGDYKLRYYLSRVFSSILTEKLRSTSDRARLYEDMVNRSQAVEQQRQLLEQEIASYLQQISLYSHLVNSAHDAILIADEEGRILNANRSLLARFGIESESVIGIEVSTLFGMPYGKPGNWETISAQARQGGWKGEIVLYHRTQGAIPADCSISTVDDPEHALLAYSVILRDIRERKALEAETRRQAAELERAYEALRELDRAKSNFLSLISHQLRTPISSILAYGELLLTEGMVEPEERESFLSVIHKEAGKLSEMVNKVLAISKMETGQMLFNFAEENLEELVRHAAAMLREAAEARGLTVDVDVPAPLRPVVCDAENLREAIGQLLDNALKFTETGGIRLEVTQKADRSLIRVSDTGKGIEGLEIDSLLEAFSRGGEVNIGAHGLGLGLPLCYLVVKAHSGTLSLKDRQGRGTEATIAIPMQPGGNRTGG